MNKVQVLVVDDSAFMRKMISDILNKDFRIEVIGTARDGLDCLHKLTTLTPDVITMDIEMPKLDGLQTLRNIMEKRPLPVVMVSSLTSQSAESTFQALHLGAVDFIEKPSGSISLDMEKVSRPIIRKVIAASGAKVTAFPWKEPPACYKPLRSRIEQPMIVAIGTSTGGPRALQKVLTDLPADFPLPIVIVQHMPRGFTRSLAARLNKLSLITVKEAEDQEELTGGTAYIAPGDFHMNIVSKGNKLYVELDQSDAVNGHRPAVNRMLSSLAALKQVRTIAVIMTGMGADGMEGLLQLKDACPQTYAIAEAQESCIVFGMPKSIIKTGLADQVLPLEQLSKEIIQTIS
ncbi:chemotaxis response regulator protein-glutamate methylesterase [Halobacillus rhizosphaerae]|uniref:protein-glutamate methylesterase/protein-glutamine glutaminase n=1 Tax=Halobacillus rhizosphaerae TaxID=3064889 RepID=UPI00398AF386